MVLCQDQGQISRSHFLKLGCYGGISVLQTHFIPNTFVVKYAVGINTKCLICFSGYLVLCVLHTLQNQRGIHNNGPSYRGQQYFPSRQKANAV